jgi:hypothetical protein
MGLPDFYSVAKMRHQTALPISCTIESEWSFSQAESMNEQGYSSSKPV